MATNQEGSLQGKSDSHYIQRVEYIQINDGTKKEKTSKEENPYNDLKRPLFEREEPQEFLENV